MNLARQSVKPRRIVILTFRPIDVIVYLASSRSGVVFGIRPVNKSLALSTTHTPEFMRNYQYVFLGMSAQAFCTAIWLVKGTTPVSVGQQLFLAALFGIVAIIIRKWKRN